MKSFLSAMIYVRRASERCRKGRRTDRNAKQSGEVQKQNATTKLRDLFYVFSFSFFF